MGSFVLVLVVVLILAALVLGVITLLYGGDPGLAPVVPDGWARPLPSDRSLAEADLDEVRFDTALRGYRMEQVDLALRRTAYDLGYKEEMITVLEAEVAALREGRHEDAELLRKVREEAARSSDGRAGDGRAGKVDAEQADAGESAGQADESGTGTGTAGEVASGEATVCAPAESRPRG